MHVRMMIPAQRKVGGRDQPRQRAAGTVLYLAGGPATCDEADQQQAEWKYLHRVIHPGLDSVPLYQRARGDSVKAGQIGIEQDVLPPRKEDKSFDPLGGLAVP